MINEEHFGAYEHNGIYIERDPRAKANILRLASINLADKRSGTEIDDHLSSDDYCQRKAVLNKLQSLRELEEANKSGQTPKFTQTLDGQSVVYFALGHGMQEVILPGSEVAVWSPEHELWYSPDGKFVIGMSDYHEMKSTRKSPMKKADVESGKTVERVIVENNPQWFGYMLATMYLENVNYYYLSVAWIIPADFETFKITASDEAILDNWTERGFVREKRRAHVDTWTAKDKNLTYRLPDGSERSYPSVVREGTLPPVSTRAFRRECENCPWLGKEPCASEVPAQNAREDNPLG